MQLDGVSCILKLVKKMVFKLDYLFLKGITSSNHSVSKILQNVKLNYYDGSVCGKLYKGVFSNQTQICAGQSS